MHPCDTTGSRTAQAAGGLDVGRITIDVDPARYLSGTPGQDRFDVTSEVFGGGPLAQVTLVDAAGEDALERPVSMLADVRRTARVPLVVAPHPSNGQEPVDEARMRTARELADAVPVVRCDETNGAHA